MKQSMNTSKFSLPKSWFLVMAVMLALSWIPMSLGQEENDVTADIKHGDGLDTVEFDTLNGKVEVNFPDDLSATDTISGTVIVEAKGKSKEEIAQNEDTLRGYVIEIAETQEVQEPGPSKQAPTPEKTPVKSPPPRICQEPPQIYVVPRSIPHYTCNIPRGSSHVSVIIRNRQGHECGREELVCNPTPPKCPPVTIPVRANCGPLRIQGQCDGRLSTSRISINRQNCPILAESPRQEICQTPNNLRGPCTIERNECGNVIRRPITMLPPRQGTGTAHHVAPSNPPPRSIAVALPPVTAENKYVFHRTGPFITTEEAWDKDAGYKATVSDGQVNFVAPFRYYTQQDSSPRYRLVPATVTFTPPPEKLTAGDSFTLSATVTGSKEYPEVPAGGPRGSFQGDGIWIKEPNSAAQQGITLTPAKDGKGSASSNWQLVVNDYAAELREQRKKIEQYRSQNPTQVDQILKQLPTADSRQPEITLYLDSGVTVRMKWLYVREK